MGICLLVIWSLIPLLASCASHYEFSIQTPSKSIRDAGWTQYTEVWDIRLYATPGWTAEYLTHATGILAQFLDNDQDGCPDDISVLDAMVKVGATMTLLDNEGQAETLRFPGGAGQHLWKTETHPECTGTGTTSSRRDAAIEEIFHLVSSAAFWHLAGMEKRRRLLWAPR